MYSCKDEHNSNQGNSIKFGFRLNTTMIHYSYAFSNALKHAKEIKLQRSSCRTNRGWSQIWFRIKFFTQLSYANSKIFRRDKITAFFVLPVRTNRGWSQIWFRVRFFTQRLYSKILRIVYLNLPTRH